MQDLKQYYNPNENTMFSSLHYTEKGCLAMIEAFTEENIEKTMNHFTISRYQREKWEKGLDLQKLACENFYFFIKEKQEDLEIDWEIDYRKQCIAFLNELGYFLPEHIEKYTKILSVSSNFTLGSCIGELVFQGVF